MLICTRVYTLVLIAAALVRKSTPPGVIYTRFYGLLHITATLVIGECIPCKNMYKGQNSYQYHRSSCTGKYTPTVTCTRAYTLVHIIAPLLQGDTALVVICTRVYALVHVTAALVHRSTPPTVICTRVYALVHMTATLV